jgi:Mn2+/Fe2+ NRAMP family transporter
MLLIIALVGTTVAPWQLFFQQSNVIDKRLTPRWMAYERADTVIGSFVVIVGAAGLIIVTAFAFGGTRFAGNFVDAGTVTAGLTQRLSPLAGDLFAVVLLNASLIGAAAVTLSTTYAFGDVFGIKHSLHRSWKDARGFYAIYAGLVALAGGIVLIPHAPLGLMTTAVQALAGILLPSATVFLLLLCNDREVLGPWVNRTWTNALASVIVGILVMLSLILAAATLFPNLNVGLVTLALSLVLLIGLLVTGAFQLRNRRMTRDVDPVLALDRATWRMPPLHMLSRPVWSTTRKIGMLTLRAYLAIAVGLMVLKSIQLAMGG